MTDLLGGRHRRIRGSVLGDLLLAAQRQGVVQAGLAVVAALPGLTSPSASALVRTRTQWRLVRVVRARAQVVLAVAGTGHAAAACVVALLYSTVLGVLLPRLALLGMVTAPFELQRLVGLGRGGLRIDALQAARIVGRAECQLRRRVAVTYPAISDVTLMGHRH